MFGLSYYINDHFLVQVHAEHHHDPHGEGHQADGGQLDKILSTHTRLGFHQDTALPTLRLYQLYVCVRGGERRIYFSLVSYRLSRIACLYSGYSGGGGR